MEPRTIESLHRSDSRLECDSQNPTVMQRLDPGEVSRYTVATPVSIQFWNVIPNFRICESQMDPIPELNRYTVAIQCCNGSHRWNPGELNRYTVAVQFWNGIHKMNPGEFNRYTVAVQFWNGIRTWNPGEFNRYTVAVQFWNGIQKMNPGEFNRYTVAVQFWNGISTWNPGEFNRYTVAVQFWNGSHTWNPGEFNRYIFFSFFFAGSPSGRLRSCPLPPPDSSESSGLLANSERLTLVNLMGFCWGFCLFFFSQTLVHLMVFFSSGADSDLVPSHPQTLVREGVPCANSCNKRCRSSGSKPKSMEVEWERKKVDRCSSPTFKVGVSQDEVEEQNRPWAEDVR